MLDEIVKEVINGLKEYYEFAKAHDEVVAMITSLGDLPNEKIVYKGHAQ